METTEMTYTPEETAKFRATVAELRKRLRDYETIQANLKALRKSKVGNASEEQMKIAINRFKITAILNYYLALKGREYRHAKDQVAPGRSAAYLGCCWYQGELARLTKEFGEVEGV